MSATIQNELLDIIAEQLRDIIISEVRGTPFTIIADESTDKSTREQLCVAVRYVKNIEKDNFVVQERFLKLEEVTNVSGNLPFAS